MRRGWIIVATVGLTCVFAGGWLAARAFESPAQREARARPPAPKPIFAPVERGSLAEEITARATITHASAEDLIPQALPERAVVTARLKRRGAVVRAGAPLLVINGRPLIVLPGRFSFYRDIVAGTSGPDVAQLQAALAVAGMSSAVAERGHYGPITQQAVRELYRAAGASAITVPGPMTRAARVAARRAKTPTARQRVPIVPLTEIAVVRRLPARLVSSRSVGAKLKPDKPAAVLASGDLVAQAGIATSVVGRIRPRMRAVLVGDDGHVIHARVAAVGGRHKPATDGLVDARISPTRRRIPASWAATEVLARITTSVVRSRALLVPTRALAQAANGTSYVLKAGPDQALVRVRVRPLGSLAGRTAVAPQSRGSLLARDRVRVG